MDALKLIAHSEVLPFDKKDKASFIAAINDSALKLNWLLLQWDETLMVYQTGSPQWGAEALVAIYFSADKALLQVSPSNAYYWQEEAIRSIAQQFVQTLQESIAANKLAERSKHPMHREKFGALLPSKTYLVTPLILYCCAFIFLLMLLSGVSAIDPSSQQLFEWGGNFKNAVLLGQWWRILTYMFLHAGIMHLLMNGFALIYIGMFLEPLIGRLRLLGAYLLSGICAGLMSIVMHPYSVGVGASGAIFGLYGVFFALLTTNLLQKTARRTMLRGLLFFIVFNLMMGLHGNTDNAAHIGGLLSGILIGYLYYPSIQKAS